MTRTPAGDLPATERRLDRTVLTQKGRLVESLERACEHLASFEASGVFADKHRSFELFRRNLYEPEPMMSDELLARTEWGVELAGLEDVGQLPMRQAHFCECARGGSRRDTNPW